MDIHKDVTWQQKSACKSMHTACTRAAGQAAARPEPGPRSVPCVLPTRVRTMACCMCTSDGVLYHECMLCRRGSALQGLSASLSENCRLRRFSESEAESPCASCDACKWNDMHKNTRFSMKKLHGMRVRMRHAPPARNASCVRRVERHVFSAKNKGLNEVSCTCQDRKSHGQACA